MNSKILCWEYFLKTYDFFVVIRIFNVGVILQLQKKGGVEAKIMKKASTVIICFLIVTCLWNDQTLTSQAEEIVVPGYHEYVTTENEAIDNWYGIARGTYLQSGTSGIVDAGKAKVNVSGTTNAHSICDKVKVAVYLDESDDGGKSFGTIGSYYFEKQNTSTCHGSKADISVTSGWWYCVRGVHTVTEGSTTETTSTQTKAMKAS